MSSSGWMCPRGNLGRHGRDGRQIKRHWVALRRAVGVHDCSLAESEKPRYWLTSSVAHAKRQAEQVRQELLAYRHSESIEPPEHTWVDRIAASISRRAEESLFAQLSERLTSLFWQHVLPYGRIRLDMSRRLRPAAPALVDTNA